MGHSSRRYVTAIAAAVFLASAGTVCAQPKKRPVPNDVCTSAESDTTKAIATNDYQSAIRISMGYIDACTQTASREDVAQAHGVIAFARMMLKEYAKAVESADACLFFESGKPTCLVIKTDALLRDGKREQGRASLISSVDIIDRAIARVSLEASRYTRASDVEALHSQLKNLRSMREVLTDMANVQGIYR